MLDNDEYERGIIPSPLPPLLGLYRLGDSILGHNYVSTGSQMSSYFRPPREVAVAVQGHSQIFYQDDQLLSEQVATDVKQELLGGSCVRMQRDISPTTVTGHQGAETSKPDQEEHEKEDSEIRDRKRTHSLEAKLATETNRSKRLEATLAKREEMLQEKEAELTNIRDIAYRQEQKIRELFAANQRQSEEINQAREELRHVITKYQQINQLLQERTEELTTAQQFLGKADNISPAEVARLVEILNAEIAQQSNFILDSLTYQKWAGSANDLEHSKGLRGLLGPWLYGNLYRRLNDPDLEFDPLLTQLALQTGFTNACKSIINPWCPPSWNDGLIFDNVYGEMGRKVGQLVAGKWRALSSTYIGVDREKNKERLRRVLLKLITAVGGPVQSGHSLSDLRSKVDDITRKALEIHEHVRIGLTSMDLEVYTIPCGTQFDASQMEDSDGPSGGKGKAENDNRQGKVICTLEMGLRYKRKVSSGNQGEFRDETGVILKSKVVLGSAALAGYGML